jgi:hypothetical protein
LGWVSVSGHSKVTAMPSMPGIVCAHVLFDKLHQYVTKADARKDSLPSCARTRSMTPIAHALEKHLTVPKAKRERWVVP